MKASHILLLLMFVALISGCIDPTGQNISSSTPVGDQNNPITTTGQVKNIPSSTPAGTGNISSSAPAEILPEGYVSEIEKNLSQIESMINEKEESFSTQVSDSAFS